MNSKNNHTKNPRQPIPWFGARKRARQLENELQELETKNDATIRQLERISGMSRDLVNGVKYLHSQCDGLRNKFAEIGALSIVDIENQRKELETQIAEQQKTLSQQHLDAQNITENLKIQVAEARRTIVVTACTDTPVEVKLLRHA
ncbi:MAG: hypothetical protein K9G60_15050 [Pseudolabrys sp.]|nr:hypothetical protein [Pseudolabrys sp.]